MNGDDCLDSCPSSDSASPNFSHQVEDVLVHIFSMLSLSDIQCLRLVCKRIYALVNTKAVWLRLLHTLDLPLPLIPVPLQDLPQAALERLAVRAIRLDANWRSPRPRMTSVHIIPVDTTVTMSYMCQQVLFTTHKDGTIRCWHDLESPLTSREATLRREDTSRFVPLIPDARIIQFSFLRACMDSARGQFLVAYVGDGLNRRTYCGVFSMPVDLRHELRPSCAARSLGQFDESKGATAFAISPSSILVAGAGGFVSIIDISSGEKRSIQVDVAASSHCEAAEVVKIVDVHILSETTFLVLTSVSVMVYNMSSRYQPYVVEPSLMHDIPRCASAWIQVSQPSEIIVITLLTTTGHVVRRRLFQCLDTHTWALEDMPASVPINFPFPVDRLSLTDLQGGIERSVWIHWERGVDGWPLRILGSLSRATDFNNDTTQEEILPVLDFRLLNDPDHCGRSDFSEMVDMCTRSVSMPKIWFDQGMGRLVLAGMAAPSIAVCEFA